MTELLTKPDVIITHESDLDGMVSGVLLRRLARKLYHTDVRLEAYNYNYWRQRELREQAGWVADLTFEARLDKANWVVVDHHVTEAQPKYAALIHDVNKSAGLLCYELCLEQGMGTEALNRLVHLNNVADLFLEEDPDFTLATDYANLVKSYGFWNLYSLIGDEIEKLLDHPLLEVMAVKRRIENPLGFAWSKENVAELSPSVGFVDTVIGNNNLIVHQLLEAGATPYAVLVTLFRRTNGVMIASFRSRNGEALEVAERLQGGGHANASGATLPRSVKSIGEAVSYMRQILAPKIKEVTSNLNSLEGLFQAAELPHK